MRVYKILLDNLQPTTYYYCKLPVDLVKTHHWSAHRFQSALSGTGKN